MVQSNVEKAPEHAPPPAIMIQCQNNPGMALHPGIPRSQTSQLHLEAPKVHQSVLLAQRTNHPHLHGHKEQAPSGDDRGLEVGCV
jgi:hypothetical protein